MLLPKNQEYYVRIREMFKKREVIKKYWMITKGIPNPPEGVIDIPMGEGQVGRYARMTLFPSYDESRKLLFKTGEGRNAGKRSRKDKWDAVTYYRVLDSNNSTALVECQPETGIKHQIRCHMAFALNCAILGDHKYSHFSKMAPQKLYPEILQKLGIRQSKVRHLPMHLHARAIVLPNFKDGRNLFISARLPQHFSQNMKWLKLKAPDK
ncbi:hypothetical protein CAPTEDRAFT_152236 [Capitella teleta]|uniref:Pseudouridylate synthase RPUSD4, mitochondrial n=1 Tax=Capitella teleta TaxID=283909 RepID=R7UGX7_CAPTE|nr:hypothetical protein CAPTEDRAFT_152236 [Capitella teleta]|eukprot:ELU05353.1 hypothetical protein CAPTEDRAFT_152236 [Capitella teleta]